MPYSRGEFSANRAQSDAVTHPAAPLMIVAGAGTGKTTTLIHRIIYLIEELQINPARILAITYTEKAATELKTRIVRQVGPIAEKLMTGTFHAFCYSVVKEFGYPAENQPTLINEGDAIYLLLNRFDKLGPFASREFPADPVRAVKNAILPFINSCRDQLIDPIEQPPAEIDDVEQTAQLEDLVRIYSIYHQLKSAAGLVDYGDMIEHCHRLMKNESILAGLQRRHRHLIIDEFQDNNYALNAVMGRLADNSGSITAVGDDDQVIYSFRGASAYNITDFRQRYGQHPGYREVNLVENYRSNQPILDLANAVIDTAENRTPKKLRNPLAPRGNRPVVGIGLTATQNRNLPEIVNHYLNHGYQPGNIAILCRTRQQAREAADHLQSHHLPVSIFTSEYFKLPVIRDILAWCEVVARGPNRDSALYRLMQSTLGPRNTLQWFGRHSRRNYSDRLDLLKQDFSAGKIPFSAQLADLLEKIEVFSKLAGKQNAGEIMWEICARTGILRPYIRRDEFTDRVALVNAGDLLTRAQDFALHFPEGNSLRRFIDYINTLALTNAIPAVEPTRPRTPAAVAVMTVHRAKGLEYPVVIVPYNQSGRFPLNFRPSRMLDSPPAAWLPAKESTVDRKQEHLAEERRLFYVALTRAEEELVLLAPPKRMSPFLKIIPENLIRKKDMSRDENATAKPTTFHNLRVEYEQRLSAALADDRFELTADLIAAIERLARLARGEDVTWGTKAWENELRTKITPGLKPDIPERLRLSASAIDTYAGCPCKYRLGYIDRIPETASKPQLTFGNIIHKVLETFHNGDYSTEQDLLDLLERFWRSEGFDYATREASFKEQGQTILHDYFRYISANPPRVLEREFQFEFELENCTIRGMIDRIDQIDSGIRVVDYKTSKTPTKASDSLQLAVYCMFLAQHDDGKISGLPREATLHFLREADEPERSHNFTTDDLDKYREQIDLVVQGINDQEFGCKTGFHCAWCDYKQLLCPAWEE